MVLPLIADRHLEGDVVTEELVHERLRLARMARGLTIESMAKQSGLRAEWLRAIDAGRFTELPAGIYARAAMRAYATALDLDGEEILRLTAPLLPAVEDPIGAMRRLNRIGGPAPTNEPVQVARYAMPDWRAATASVIDASTMALGLLILVTSTIATGLPMSLLDRDAGAPLFTVMLLLAVIYYVVFGGIVGRTVGDYVVSGGESAQPTRVNLHAVAVRTGEVILRDAQFIERVGQWVGRSVGENWHWPLANFHSNER